MEFFHNISKSQNLQELEHSIFVLQIGKKFQSFEIAKLDQILRKS